MTEPTDGRGTGWSRRSVLRGGALATGGAAGVGWAVGRRSGAGDPTGPVTHGSRVERTDGERQAGVETPPQAHLSLLGLDLRPDAGPEELGLLLAVVADDTARLAAGRPALADTEPELALVPARLTVTLGLGPRVVGWGAGSRRVALDPLPAFATDRFEPGWGQTDLVVQVCGDDPLTVAHARRVLLRGTAAYAAPVWVQDGFRRASGSETTGATMRNVLGQVDGTANPRGRAELDDLVWGGPLGAHSTTLVVRRIRAEMAAWDRVGREGKELVTGRRLGDGAPTTSPTTGGREHDEPDLEATDRYGFPVIDAASHLRRARGEDPRQRFLRRSYNYAVTDPARPLGEDTGVVFLAFGADPARQFVPVQRRLAELDRLNDYTTTIGSAVYAVPATAGLRRPA